MRKFVVALVAAIAVAVPVSALAGTPQTEAAKATRDAALAQAKAQRDAAQDALQARLDAAKAAREAAEEARAEASDAAKAARKAKHNDNQGAPFAVASASDPYSFTVTSQGSAQISASVDASGDFTFTTSGLTPGDKYAASCSYTSSVNGRGVNLGFSSWFANSAGVLSFDAQVEDFSSAWANDPLPGSLTCWFRADDLVFSGPAVALSDGFATFTGTLAANV